MRRFQAARSSSWVASLVVVDMVGCSFVGLLDCSVVCLIRDLADLRINRRVWVTACSVVSRCVSLKTNIHLFMNSVTSDFQQRNLQANFFENIFGNPRFFIKMAL